MKKRNTPSYEVVRATAMLVRDIAADCVFCDRGVRKFLMFRTRCKWCDGTGVDVFGFDTIRALRDMGYDYNPYFVTRANTNGEGDVI